MLRIARVDDGGSRTTPALRLEGKLLGPWVTELSRACDELRVSPNALCLDFTDVTFIDSAGLGLIHDLIRQGATTLWMLGLHRGAVEPIQSSLWNRRAAGSDIRP